MVRIAKVVLELVLTRVAGEEVRLLVEFVEEVRAVGNSDI